MVPIAESEAATLVYLCRQRKRSPSYWQLEARREKLREVGPVRAAQSEISHTHVARVPQVDGPGNTVGRKPAKVALNWNLNQLPNARVPLAADLS